MPERYYDLAVVGGGVTGLFCCLNSPNPADTALFEATARFGGKLETRRIGPFLAECGSMRFDPERQPLMRRLIADFDLGTAPFPEYTAPPASRGGIYRLERGEKGRDALELWALGISKVLGKTVSEMMATPGEVLAEILRDGKHRGRFLWEYGLWELLADVLSYGAIKYIMTEGSFFHSIHENPGVPSMLTWVKMLQMSPHLRGIRGGMQSLPDAMLERVKARGVNVHSGHRLTGLDTDGAGIRLEFDGVAVAARKVILALPATPLKRLSGLPNGVRGLLDTVLEIPLIKAFFATADPWWDEDLPNRNVESFPTRELHYHREGRQGLVMLYSDRPTYNFWRRFVTGGAHSQAQAGGNEEIPRTFARALCIPRESVTAYAIRDWTREPYGAGVHLWRPGVNIFQVMPRLEAFSLTGSGPRNVHICGEAFSDYQGFIEGALRSATRVLEQTA